MNIIETQSKPIATLARMDNGKVDINAYINLEGVISQDGLTIAVKTIGARVRYGHLDLEIVPVAGTGHRWIERKNIILHNDPALNTSPF